MDRAYLDIIQMTLIIAMKPNGIDFSHLWTFYDLPIGADSDGIKWIRKETAIKIAVPIFMLIPVLFSESKMSYFKHQQNY